MSYPASHIVAGACCARCEVDFVAEHSDPADNLARACRRCNAAKSDKPLLLFLARRTACRR